MTAAEAMEAAKKFVGALDARGFTYSCVEARKSKHTAAEWAVVFEVHDAKGHLIDGPAVVLVDEGSRAARFLGGP